MKPMLLRACLKIRLGAVFCGDAPASPPCPQPKSLAAALSPIFRQALSLAFCGILAGCAAPRQGLWDQRLGNYTFQQALEDMGAPSSYQQLHDGSVVAEWLVKREPGWADVFAIDADFESPSLGINPVPFEVQAARDRYVRLTFARDGRLIKWKRVYV